ncbi:MAG: hypothetical protein IRY96_01695 [Burkholderiales bacterium]|nr:hypothetical protein [Burkholderiales bacterium]PZN01934.1 MAG: hypothetical protein DIU74_09040 [Pseudomonadota bacterium]
MKPARRRLLQGLGGALLCAGLPKAAPAAQDFAALPKALWVWLKSLHELEGLSRFAGQHGFEALMIHFRKDARALMLSAQPEALAHLRSLREGGIAIYALAGEPQWAMRDAVPDTVEQLIEIERRHALFDGLHYDVEPHSLPAWRERGGRERLMHGLVRLARHTRTALPSHLKLQFALNPRHSLVSTGSADALSGLAPYVDEVALMAYRDAPQRQLEAAAPAAERLHALDIPWRMGVLSNPPREKGVSYHGLAAEAFEARMQELWAGARRLPHCRGLIFENYHSLRALLRGPSAA